MSHILGTHAVADGGIDMAVRRAAAAGFSAVQVFTAIPRFYGDRSSIREERIERFHQALAETGTKPEHVLVHAAYVLNTATADEEKGARAAAGLAKEMERSTALAAGGVCFHPGSSPDAPEASAERVARAMALALEGVGPGVRLYVENTAGAGKTFGRSPEEIGLILSALPESLRRRAGYGLDTCHLYASGYDIAASPAALKEVLDAFEEAAGGPPSFFHLNDSEGALGSNRDRHRLLGEGEIGAEPFAWLLDDPRSHGVPLILETPQERPEVPDEDASADPWDVRMHQLLMELGAKP